MFSFENPPKNFGIYPIVHEEIVKDGIYDRLEAYGSGGAVGNIRWNEGFLKDKALFAEFDKALSEKGDFGLWMYDEYGYPSGSLNGVMLEGHPEYEAIGLAELRCHDGAPVLPEGGLYFVKAYAGETELAVEKDKIFVPDELKDREIKAYFVKILFEGSHAEMNGYGKRHYPNLLNKKAMRRFVELAYDSYKEAVPNFGERIEAVFTDEPSLMAPYVNTPKTYPFAPVAWEETLPERFLKEKGYDLTAHLPSLFDGDSKEDKRVRVDFYDIVSKQLKESFFDTIADWCHENGTRFSGHCLLEERLFYHVGYYGNLMRCLTAMDIPGIDILGCVPELFLREWFLTPKFASSVASAYNKEGVMCEVCPAASKEAFAQNPVLYITATLSFLYFLGVTHINSYFSMDRHSAEEGRLLSGYAARLRTFLDGAASADGIGVYYPIEDMQALYKPIFEECYRSTGEARALDDRLWHLAETILNKKRNFEMLSSDMLREATMSEGALTIGRIRCSVLVLPAEESMPEDVAHRLAEWEKQGLTVLRGDFTIAENEEFVSESRIFVGKFIKDGVEFTYIVNTSEKEALVENRSAYEWVKRPMDGTSEKAGKELLIEPYQGIFLV